MNRFLKSMTALAALVICSTLARAVWDSTTGNMPNSYQLCWGVSNNACIYGSTLVSNLVRIQTGGTDALTIDSTQKVTVPGTLTVTGAATFSTVMSSYTVANATGSYTLSTLGKCVAQSTVTLTLPTQTSVIWVTYTGASSVTVQGSTITVGVLVDGAFATVAGVAETASKGFISIGNGPGEGSNDVGIDFGPLPISGLSSGTHNICLVLASTSGTLTIDSTNEISVLTAYYLP